MGLECQSETASGKSLPWTSKSRETIKQIIRLLEAATRQLDLSESAHGALGQAGSLLRRQIALHNQKARGNRGGQLLPWQVRKVLTYLDSHLTERVRVADLSALARCGEAHFSRQFRRTFGESPHAYVVKRRVELAARRMLDTEIPLTEIALSCGFADQAHLTKCFRHLMLDTPSAWRRTRRTEEALSSSGEIQDATLQGDRHSVSAIARFEFRQDIPHVRLDGILRNLQLEGNEFV
jgi:AraC family transcriptional regulator